MSRFILPTILLGLTALTACGPAQSQGGAGGDPNLYLQDDFSDSNSGWTVETNADTTLGYGESYYHITVLSPGLSVWGQAGLELTDMVVTVDTQAVAGPQNNEFGVMCRYSRSGDTPLFYFGLISSDGYYAAGKTTAKGRTILASELGSFQPSTAVNATPQAVNQLRLTCQGNQITFAVNDTVVGQFTDNEITHGDVGLLAGTYDEGNVQVHFDNVTVRKP